MGMELCAYQVWYLFCYYFGIPTKAIDIVLVSSFQKSAPARIKDLNYYNTGPAFEAFIAIFKPLLAEKIRNRVSF